MAERTTRRERARHIRALLTEEGPNVRAGTQGFNAARDAAMAALGDYEALRDRARATKEDAIERLPELIETVTGAVEANGGHVHLADSPAEANRHIARVVRERDAGVVVKSKSMTTEELDVNEHLAALGVDVYETDLGEFVVQIADESPSHLVAPAIHRSSASIADLFNARFDPDEPLETPDELTAFARDYLGERIAAADVGMTGANFVLAESGTVVLVTNEGNARKCAAVPDTHVAVAGIEKLIPSIAELQPFVELLARSAGGQPVSRYLTLLSPPVDTPAVDLAGDGDVRLSRAGADRAFHLVLVDNGRWAMRDDEVLREALYCIRCSACLNSCANFQHVGGHAFGGETYTGGIGTGWEAGVEGLDAAAGFNDLCTGCTRCVDRCPVKIDIPWINTAIRGRVAEAGADPALDAVYEGLLPDEEPSGVPVRSRLFASVDRLARVASATAPVSNWLAARRVSRYLLDRFLGIDRRRELPRFERHTLRDRVDAVASDPDVVLFADVYTNHVLVDRGLAAVAVLDALGETVAVPPVHATGREPLSQGMIATAEARVAGAYDHLAGAIDGGTPVVFVEPSDLAMVRHDAEKLLPTEQFERLSSTSYELFEYLQAAVDPDRLSRVVGPTNPDETVFYHGHCQQRTLGLERPTVAVLEALGYDVTTSSVECCGMAGSFGYKSEYYELSMDVGSDLAQQVARADADHVVASGTSCIEQLDALGVGDVRHPVELVAPE